MTFLKVTLCVTLVTFPILASTQPTSKGPDKPCYLGECEPAGPRQNIPAQIPSLPSPQPAPSTGPESSPRGACEILLGNPQAKVIRYRGQCQDGLAHGRGQADVTADGTNMNFSGTFVEGRPEGEIRYTDSAGTYFSGYVSNWILVRGMGVRGGLKTIWNDGMPRLDFNR